MDFSTDSLVALLQIIGVNIILSGDNAVVIALACRSLPPRQQRFGVILGAGAAVVLRIVFTGFVAYLMTTPYLKILGGLLLFWIGYKLLTEEESGDDGVRASSHLWGAVRTVVIADAVMSLDNVIAVAAAAKGSFILLVIGLGISIPLVVYGATLMIVLIKKVPFIVTLGAALIGYIGGEVIVSDPAVAPWIDANAHWLHIVGPLLGAVLVLDLARLKTSLVPQPKDAAEGVAAPAILLAVRWAFAWLGQLVLLRIPLIVGLLAGWFGFAGTDAALDSAGISELPVVDIAGPIVGTLVALAIVELIARLVRRIGFLQAREAGSGDR